MGRRKTVKLPIFIVERKHHEGDCAVACLASLLNVKYEEVLVAAASIKRTVLVDGLVNSEIIRTAALFGMVLEERVGDEIDYKSTGILGMKLMHNKPDEEHAVVMSHGLIFDPEDGEVWRVKDYLVQFGASEIDLLEKE